LTISVTLKCNSFSEYRRSAGSTLPRRHQYQLPPNSSSVNGQWQTTIRSPSGYFQGCTTFEVANKLGQPEYEMRLGNQLIKQAAGKVEILSLKYSSSRK
jgi:hypothetical protein